MISRVSQHVVFGALVALSAAGAFSAEASTSAKKLPTEVAILSMPPATLARPAEVKVTSMSALPPTQVRVEVPMDESARKLVTCVFRRS
jgi:hypothetical protein